MIIMIMVIMMIMMTMIIFPVTTHVPAMKAVQVEDIGQRGKSRFDYVAHDGGGDDDDGGGDEEEEKVDEDEDHWTKIEDRGSGLNRSHMGEDS